MKTISRFKVLSFFLIAAYLLAACGGTLPQSISPAQGSKVQANVVAFTGIVEAINGSEWMVAGQKITLDPHAALDPNIGVGDEVKVEANVSADGAVVALKVESSVKDDIVSTSSADASSTPDPIGTPSPDTSSTPDVSSSPDASTPSAPQAAANQNEIFGAVQALTASTITVNGVTYNLSNSTEFKNALTVGDQVKLHVLVNADGTITVREVEKSAAASFDDNSSSNGSDDGPNHDVNDDHSNDSSHDQSDDHGNDDSNDDNGGNSGHGGD